MWAATIPLRLGRYRVGIRVDTDRTRAQLTALLEAFLDPAPERAPSNFSIRRPHGRVRRTPGTLHIGGVQVAESNSFDVLVQQLVDHLASVATDIPADAVRTTLRPFERSGSVVLVAAHRSVHIDLDAHTREIACWQPIIQTSGPTLLLPPPLAPLRWRAAKLDPVGDRQVFEFPVVGIVADFPVGDLPEVTNQDVPATPSTDPLTTLTRLWADAAGDVDGWGVALVTLREEGRILDATAVGDHVADLFGRGVRTPTD